jgi:hypothetical protein
MLEDVRADEGLCGSSICRAPQIRRVFVAPLIRW